MAINYTLLCMKPGVYLSGEAVGNSGFHHNRSISHGFETDDFPGSHTFCST